MMVVLNKSLWSLNATMMWEKCFFLSFQNLVVKVSLSWMQLLANLQMKSLSCCANLGNLDLLMRSLFWCMINMCKHVFILVLCWFFLKKSLYYQCSFSCWYWCLFYESIEEAIVVTRHMLFKQFLNTKIKLIQPQYK